MSKKIYLIDGNSFIYRMFFALPEFSTQDGRIVNATFGMAKFFVNQLVREKPDYLVFIKDAKWDNFRHDIYSEYKATRERMPDNLRSQIGDIESMIQKMDIDIIEIPGYEADDVIATLAVELWKDSDNEVFILSGDKDLYALTTWNVKIYDTQKKKISGPEETKEKFWIESMYVTDYLAICGDTSDNIPGISWIWPKKAVALINEFGSVESIYDIIEQVHWGEKSHEDFDAEVGKLMKWKTFEKLYEGKEMAFLSKKLATLHTEVDMSTFVLDSYKFQGQDIVTPEVVDFFKELEFFSLIEEKKELQNWEKVGKKVKIIGDAEWLKDLEKDILNSEQIVLDTETTNIDVQRAELVWISVLLDDDKIYYINRLHKWPSVDDNILQAFVSRVLTSDFIIIGHNLKYDLEILESFLQNDSQKWEESNFWQMHLGI